MKHATPAHLSSAAFLVLIAALLCGTSIAHSSEKDRDRQLEKLKKKDVETLSLQSLTDIYTACLKESVATEEEAGTIELKPNDFKKYCHDERKHLVSRTSNRYADEIDILYTKGSNIFLKNRAEKRAQSLTEASPQESDQVN